MFLRSTEPSNEMVMWSRGPGNLQINYSKTTLKLLRLTPAAGWLAGWLAGWPAGWRVGWLAGWLADWLAGLRAGWLAGCLACWLAGWLAGCWLADCWLPRWLAGCWLVGWLAGWLAFGWLAGRLECGNNLFGWFGWLVGWLGDCFETCGGWEAHPTAKGAPGGGRPCHSEPAENKCITRVSQRQNYKMTFKGATKNRPEAWGKMFAFCGYRHRCAEPITRFEWCEGEKSCSLMKLTSRFLIQFLKGLWPWATRLNSPKTYRTIAPTSKRRINITSLTHL